MKQYTYLLLITLIPMFIFGQTMEEKREIIRDYNLEQLKSLAENYNSKAKFEKQKALDLALQKGWFVRKDENGILYELMGVSEEGNPLYYITNNINAAKSTRANTLHNGGILGLNVEGQNMTAHVWDGGLARSTHQEYDGIGGSNRFSIGDGTTALHYHSAHVTGTIMASGYSANAKGMAPQAHALGYEWNNDVSEATTAAANGMLLSNHSYGWGASGIPDWYFGAYNYRSREWDVVMNYAPYYLMVCSAGNDGNDNSSNGDPLNGNSSYDKLSGFKTSKNNIVVANGNDANIDANGNLISVVISSSSSEGPTDDYRIKPDITGNGTSLYSSYEGSDSEYGTISGTSMASPNVCGTLLLLQQHFHNLNGSFMRAATLKGLALHTADDAGPAGPDVVYGWGLLNAKAAASAISNNGVASSISELNLSQGSTYSVNVQSDGINNLIASISWTDPAGTANTGISNDNTPVLVNDLDIRVTKSGSTYYPYKLTSITTNGTGDNFVDPFEKVIVNGASGIYTITVTHKGSLSGGSQNFSLIVTGKSGLVVAPVANFEADITTPATGQTVSFTDLSYENPTSWSWSFSPATVTYVGGTTSASQNPQVQFNTSGYYTVSLTATNSAGSDGETKTNYILATDPPVANFNADNVNPSIGQAVYFTDLSTGNPTSWQWTFEGGTPSFWYGQSPPAIQFNNAGTWDVTLEVSNLVGTDIELKPDYIAVSEWAVSTATLSLPNVSVGTPGEIAVPIHLDAISSNLVVGIQVSFYYDETYVTWMGTSSTPEDGISYISPELTPLGGDWLWNSLPGNLIFIWIDPTLSGVTVSPGNLLVFRFNYLGGLTFGQSTPLTFSLTKTYADGSEEKIVNELTDENYQPYALTLVNGTVINDVSTKTVNLKVLLEGPYNGTDMTPKLTSVLPLTQPYNVSPWNYGGSESATSIPADVIDWILLDLRDASDAASATPGTTIERQATFLLSDGSIVGMDGTSLPELSANVTQNLFVVIHHRNHLSMMSSTGLTANAGIYSHDFTTGSGQAYGGTLAQKELSPGQWGMYGGNGDGNGIVDENDAPMWENQAGTKGYLESDYNLDTESNNIDKDDFWAPNVGEGSQVPN